MDEKKIDPSTSLIIEIPEQEKENDSLSPQPQPQPQHQQRQRPNSILYKTCWAIERIAQRTLYRGRPIIVIPLIVCIYLSPRIYCDEVCPENRTCAWNSIIFEGVFLLLMIIKTSATAYLNEVVRREREREMEEGIRGENGTLSGEGKGEGSPLIEG